MTKALDLFALDRTLERAVAERAREARAGFTAPESALERFREVSGLRTLDLLVGESPTALETPLREALRPFIADLLLARLTYAAVHDYRARVAAPLVLAPPSAAGPRRHLTWDDALAELLVQPNAAGADDWLAALVEAGPVVGDAARELRGRVAEAEERVRTRLSAHPGPLWQAIGQAAPDDVAAALADAILTATDDLSRDVLRDAAKREARERGVAPGAANVLIVGLARDATPTFPASVRARWFEELFGAHLTGLNVRPGALPRVFGGASFARGLAAFGRALARATSARELPFAMRETPHGLEPARIGALFGSLAGSVPFLRTLGATTARAREDRRAVGRSFLVTIRLAAVRVLLAQAAPRDTARYEELTARYAGVPLPGPLMGALPRSAMPLAETRDLLAMALHPALAKDVVDRFDEDWFKNPRAFGWLRARGAVPVAEHAVKLEVTDAPSLAEAVQRALAEMIV